MQSVLKNMFHKNIIKSFYFIQFISFIGLLLDFYVRGKICLESSISQLFTLFNLQQLTMAYRCLLMLP